MQCGRLLNAVGVTIFLSVSACGGYESRIDGGLLYLYSP